MNSERIAAAEIFVLKLHELTNNLELLQTDRNRAAAAAFGITLDHHAAIVSLMGNSFYSSSFALLRSLFEGYLRGLWLKHCAEEIQISNYFRGEEPPKDMVAKIEATDAFGGGTLSRIKREVWGKMCAFTHTGGLHLQRWQSQDYIEPTFSPPELEECLNCAELFGAMAAVELIQLTKFGEDGASVLQLMRARWPG